MATKVDEIRLLPPRRVPMTAEHHCEAVDLLAQLLLDAARRRARRDGDASVGVPMGASSGVTSVVAVRRDQAAMPHQRRRSGDSNKPTYKEKSE